MKVQAYTGTQYAQRDTSLPTLSGSAPGEINKAGSIAQIYVGGEYFEVPVDPATGRYSWTASNPLPDGDYSVSVTIKDKAGNLGKPTLFTLRVDTTPPEAPDLINLYDDQGAVSGSFDPGSASDDRTPTLTGLAQKGATVYLRDDSGNIIDSAVADSVTGKWVMTPELKDGANTLTLVTEETFANKPRQSAPSDAFTLVVGSGTGVLLQQASATETAADDAAAAGREAGILAYQGTQYAQRDTPLPTLSGSAPGEINKVGSIAKFYVGGEYFEVPVDPATGRYSWTASNPLPDGDYSVSVTIEDKAGNVGKPTLFTLRVDTTPPDAPELLNLYDDHGLKTGSFDAGNTTDDKRPTLTGVAQPGASVYLRDDSGVIIGTAVANSLSGKWVIIPEQDLKDGVNTLTLEAEERFATKLRIGPASPAFTIVIGDDAPVLPPNTITLNDAVDDVGAFTGILTSGALTDDTTPTLRGDVSTGHTVIVYYRLAGGSAWTHSATATVSGNKWSWTPADALAYGEYEFQASIGTHSSAPFTLDIATADDIVRKTQIESVKDDFGTWQGELSSGAITDDATPTFSGRGEANSKVVLRFTQPGQLANTVVVDVDSSGHWTWTPASNLQTGNWGFEVQQQGQSGWSDSFDLSIDSNDRFTPVITHAYDDVGTPQNLVNGDTTNDSTPTLKGTGMPGSVITVEYAPPTGGWIYAGTATVNASGNWEMTSPVLNSSGKYDYRAKANDGNNESAWSPTFGLNFDDLPDGGYEDFSEILSTGAIQAGYERTFTSGLKLKLVTYAEEVVRGNLATPGFGDNGYWGFNGYRVIDGSNTRFTFPKPTNSFSLEIRVVQHGILTLFGADGRQLGQEILGAGVGNGNKSFTETYRAYGGEKVASFALRSLDGYDDAGFGLISVEWGSGRYSSFEVEENDNSFLNDSTETATASYIEDDVHSVSHVNDLYAMPVIGNASKTDTLQLTGKDQFLDLTTLSSQIESVEIIDITGSGDNTLKLDLNALLQHGEKDLFIEDGKTQLVVNGNEGDVVQLVDILPEGSDISEWKQQDGTVTVAGVEYNVYSHNDAELLVQQGVKTELI